MFCIGVDGYQKKYGEHHFNLFKRLKKKVDPGARLCI